MPRTAAPPGPLTRSAAAGCEPSSTAAGKRRSGSGGEEATDPKKTRPAFADVTNADGETPAPCAAAATAPPAPAHAAPAAGHLAPAPSLAATGDDGFGAPANAAAAAPPPGLDPIDAADAGDALACVDYVADICDALAASERRCRPCAAYVEAVQGEVNATMRAILVDWLVEVAAEFRLVSDTLYAAVAYVDRVLSVTPVPRGRLQLVGVACMLVAAKYEEIYAPSVDECVFITDNTYTRADVLAAEREALDALEFDLSAPTSKTFLRRFVKAAAADGGGGDRLAPLAAYICELGLLEYNALQFLPSRVAAAAVVVARVVLGADPWPPALARAARCAPADVAAPAALLHAALTRAPTSSLPAVRDKYGAPAYRCVAALPPPPPLPDLERL